jgi:hypothetical protein
MALFGLSCPLCIILFILLIINFFYNISVFKEISHQHQKIIKNIQIKENFNSCNGYLGGPDMKIPYGQTVSEVPLTKQCLLAKYAHSCQNKLKPLAISKKPIHLKVEGTYPITKTRCDNLNIHQCLNTPTCGWLVDRTGKNGRCLAGTPIGPNNPKDIPDSEDSIRRNMTDMWKYSRIRF